MFSVDPGADATLGGMAATRASGTTAVRYGTMRENVLGLTVVLADGRVINTGGRARKSSAGYDLTRLFVGSEGTLGVITEITLRLHPLPEAVSAAVCAFPTIEAAVNTVIATIQLGVPVARIELLDEVQMDAVNRSLAGSTTRSRRRCSSSSTATPSATSPNRRRRCRRSRPSTAARIHLGDAARGSRRGCGGRGTTRYYASLALRPGSKAWTTDVCVPISRLADCIVETKTDIDGVVLTGPLVGHAGDGNFHLHLSLDPDRPDELAEARAPERAAGRRARWRWAARAPASTASAIGKKRFLEEHGDGVERHARDQAATRSVGPHESREDLLPRGRGEASPGPLPPAPGLSDLRRLPSVAESGRGKP